MPATRTRRARRGSARTRRTTRGAGRPGTGNVKTWTRKNGDVGYAVRFFDQHGVRQHDRCGLESEGWSHRRAEIFLAQRLEEVARGTYVASLEAIDDVDEADPMFGTFAPEVLAEHAVTVEPKTREFNSNMLRNHLLPEFARLRLSEITYERIDAFKRRRLQLMHQIRAAEASGIALRLPDRRRMKLSERTINHSVAVLDFILAEAVRRRSIALGHNEARDRRLRVKVPKKAVRDWLEGDELLQLLEVAGRTDSPTRPATLARAEEVRRLRDDRTFTIVQTARAMGIARSTVWLLYNLRPQDHISQARTIIAILAASGARNTEVCLLRPIDLDFAHGKIRVARSKTRKGVREIDMTPWLRAQLERWVEHLGPDHDPLAPLFVSRRGNAFNKDTLNDLIQRVYDETGRIRTARGMPPLPTRLTAHVFRRSYITHMLEAGAPPSYVQEQVGHEDARTTLEIYSRVLRNRDRRRHAEAFDEIMRGAVPSQVSGASDEQGA